MTLSGYDPPADPAEAIAAWKREEQRTAAELSRRLAAFNPPGARLLGDWVPVFDYTARCAEYWRQARPEPAGGPAAIPAPHGRALAEAARAQTEAFAIHLERLADGARNCGRTEDAEALAQAAAAARARLARREPDSAADSGAADGAAASVWAANVPTEGGAAAGGWPAEGWTTGGWPADGAAGGAAASGAAAYGGAAAGAANAGQTARSDTDGSRADQGQTARSEADGSRADQGHPLPDRADRTQPGRSQPGRAVPIGGHTLPPLPYAYDALEPYIDEATMRIHHDRHHRAYVDGLNRAERALQAARASGQFDLVKHWERELAFNGAGHYLHTIFWNVMSPQGGGRPTGPLAEAIDASFGSFEAFRRQFSAAAEQVEGGGWAILVWSPRSGRLEILQAEKHQNLSQWDVVPLLPLDVWEHAYYLKHQNRRADYIRDWWNVVNWPCVAERFAKASQLRWEPF